MAVVSTTKHFLKFSVQKIYRKQLLGSGRIGPTHRFTIANSFVHGAGRLVRELHGGLFGIGGQTWLRSVVAGLVLMPVLGGCASSNAVPYSDFERLEIVVLPSEEVVGKVPSKSETVVGGVAGGAMVGLLSSAMYCGPLLVIAPPVAGACFASLAPASAAAGAVIGGGVGLAVRFPEEKEPIREGLAKFDASHNLGEELAASLTRKLPQGKVDGSGAFDARLRLRAKDLGASGGLNSGKVSIEFTVESEFQLGRNLDAGRRVSLVYACSTSSQSVEAWLAEDGVLIEKKVMLCVEAVAGRIDEVLRQPQLILESPLCAQRGRPDWCHDQEAPTRRKFFLVEPSVEKFAAQFDEPLKQPSPQDQPSPISDIPDGANPIFCINWNSNKPDWCKD